MQKKEYTLGEEEEKHYEEGHSDLVQQMKPWAYSYSPRDDQGAAWEEQTTRLPQLGLWIYSNCHADGHDLAFPPKRRGSDAITCIGHEGKCGEEKPEMRGREGR
jgi:hypothetical protein